jgi:hypothetical protein
LKGSLPNAKNTWKKAERSNTGKLAFLLAFRHVMCEKTPTFAS